MNFRAQYDAAERSGGIGWTVIAGHIALGLAWSMLALVFTLYPAAMLLGWIK